MVPVIQTKRLLLRPVQADDAADLHEVFSDPRAMKYWSSAPHTALEQTAAFLRETMEGRYETTAKFSIVYEGRVIGNGGFWPIPEVGYILHPEYWQRGLGTEAMQAFITYGFETRGFDEITADVDPDNAASIHLLEKLGFQETHRAKDTLEIDGKWFDSVYFALKRSAHISDNPVRSLK